IVVPLIVIVAPEIAAPAESVTVPDNTGPDNTGRCARAYKHMVVRNSVTINPKARPSPLRAGTFAWVQTHDSSFLFVDILRCGWCPTILAFPPVSLGNLVVL